MSCQCCHGHQGGGVSDTAALLCEMKALLSSLFQCLLPGIFSPEAKERWDNPKPGRLFALTHGLQEATWGWTALCLESFVSNSRWILDGLALTLGPSPADMWWEMSPLISIASSRAELLLDIRCYAFPNIYGSPVCDSPPSASECIMVGNSGLGLISPWHSNME